MTTPATPAVPAADAPRHDDGSPAPEDTIAKAKRILAAVDAYHDSPTRGARDHLRGMILGQLEAASLPASPAVLRQAMEALTMAGQLIAWQHFGECRAYAKGPIPAPAETDAGIKSALSAIKAELAARPVGALSLSDDEIRAAWNRTQDPIAMVRALAPNGEKA